MAHGLIPWYSDGSNTKSYTYNVILHGTGYNNIYMVLYIKYHRKCLKHGVLWY